MNENQERSCLRRGTEPPECVVDSGQKSEMNSHERQSASYRNRDARTKLIQETTHRITDGSRVSGMAEQASDGSGERAR